MARQGSLYTGFIRGRAGAIKLGPNDPALDTSQAEKDAIAKTRAHLSKGTIRASSPKSAPARPVRNRGVAGSKVGSATRIRGGVI